MRLVSYNFRRGRLRRAKNPWLRVTKTVGADIVCAQETVRPGRFFDETLAACGGHLHNMVWVGPCGGCFRPEAAVAALTRPSPSLCADGRIYHAPVPHRKDLFDDDAIVG